MSQINNNLVKDETVMYMTGLHWYIFAGAIFWGVLAVAMLILSLIYVEHELMLQYGAIFFGVIAAFKAAKPLTMLQTSEFAVTNKRIAIKVGFAQFHMVEIFLDKVEGIQINQSFLG